MNTSKPTDPRFVDLTGQRFGRLTVVSWAYKDDQRQSHWNCKCDCGGTSTPCGTALKNGTAASCGCFQRKVCGDNSRTHGMSKSATYRTWTSMKNRCLNPNNPKYPSYGGRGIRVCERWMIYENFLSDMGFRPTGKTIERKDNDGDYCKENCVWATSKVQSRNKRRTIRVTIDGVSKSVRDWCEQYAISFNTVESIHYRTKRTWQESLCLTIERRALPAPRNGFKLTAHIVS
jgi:hypothetical protein